ncbi:MAG: hypothetical protein M3Y40_09760 [Chloroflexota bacterium]|nr:hypothetical protein [Chloroflexota bacterium]
MSTTNRTEATEGGPGPEEGGGPPIGMPWTLVVDGEDWSADLEHAAPLPRIGETVEYIAEDGTRRTFRVVTVVHTVQGSASERPPVGSEPSGPNSTVSGDHAAHVPFELRAGLPRVHVVAD